MVAVWEGGRREGRREQAPELEQVLVRELGLELGRLVLVLGRLVLVLVLGRLVLVLVLVRELGLELGRLVLVPVPELERELRE